MPRTVKQDQNEIPLQELKVSITQKNKKVRSSTKESRLPKNETKKTKKVNKTKQPIQIKTKKNPSEGTGKTNCPAEDWLPEKYPSVEGYAVVENTNCLVKLMTIGYHNLDRPGVINDQMAVYYMNLGQVVETYDLQSGRVIDNYPLKKYGLTGIFFKTPQAAVSNYWLQYPNSIPSNLTGKNYSFDPITGLVYFVHYQQQGKLVKSVELEYYPDGLLRTLRTRKYDRHTGRKLYLKRVTYNRKEQVIGTYRASFIIRYKK